ncbi:MAG TPA: hypothetical protein VFE51_17030 [Verrucomicrobiae bacterium]|nr:hypothetical protein [Verrucomicrobiae bacterium]
MTYLIQSKTTGQYFQPGGWTHESRRAQEYSDIAKAMTACLRHELREVELVLCFGSEVGRNYSLQLSLPETLVCG